MSRRPTPTAGVVAALLALSLLPGCGRPLQAPYVAPEPGTTYFYSGGMSNRITANDGLRTRFVDGRGRDGSRVALFLSEPPQTPLTIDTAALNRLWPLEVGKEVSVRVKRGDETYNWEFRVQSYEQVSVPMGAYMAYVVSGTQTPELVRDPKGAVTSLNTFYYAPEVKAVVRFRSKYLSGPTAGREYESAIEAIFAPRDSVSLRRFVAAREAMAKRADSLAKVQQAGKASTDSTAKPNPR